jgi:hypothetical protein
MQNLNRNGWKILIVFIVLSSVAFFALLPVSAQGEQPIGPDRYSVQVQETTIYDWWLTNWTDNKVVCSLHLEHEGLPSSKEILNTCGSELYTHWVRTPICKEDEDTPTCQGYYLAFAGSRLVQRNVGISLPPPMVWLSLDGCTPINSTFRCDELPTLILEGEEPLNGYVITSLSGRKDGVAFTCDATCQLDLLPTTSDGTYLEFWANSSYGDTSKLFNARIRIAASDDLNEKYWYVDLISSQWREPSLAACSQTWNVFPPVGGPPPWLGTPQISEDLATNIPYEFLAMNLIKHGIVDASGCLDGGFLSDGSLNSCGLDASRDSVNDWQNRFNESIFSAAQVTGIPAQLIKNLFARESQFWPEATNGHPEAGLGQMTNAGADSTFLWNPIFFEQFCPSILPSDSCKKGYSNLTSIQRAELRNNLVDEACPDCPLGIDLDKAEKSVQVFAETMLANCAQTGMVVELNDQKHKGTTVSYEDFWKFSLVNYNAGPGCLGLAVDQTNRLNEKVDWSHVSSHLTPACSGALDYVMDISGETP